MGDAVCWRAVGCHCCVSSELGGLDGTRVWNWYCDEAKGRVVLEVMRTNVIDQYVIPVYNKLKEEKEAKDVFKLSSPNDRPAVAHRWFSPELLE